MEKHTKECHESKEKCIESYEKYVEVYVLKEDVRELIENWEAPLSATPYTKECFDKDKKEILEYLK